VNGIARASGGKYRLDPRYTDLKDLVLDLQHRINDTGESARVRITAGAYGSDVGAVVALRPSVRLPYWGPRIPAAVGYQGRMWPPPHPEQPLP